MNELLAHLATRGSVAYQAPLDPGVGRFIVKRLTIYHETPAKTTLRVFNRETKTLTLNVQQHFERFRTIERSEIPA